MSDNERVNPLRFTDNETGNTYELDFSRESIAFAEGREFRLEDVTDFPVTKIPTLWYFAFRKNHKNVARSQTDALLDKIGGLTDEMLERLLLLYNQAALSNSNVLQTKEDLEKNARVTVEL